MARYTDDSRERVRDAVDMVDLVGARVELRTAGANRYEGLCPFHDERTPSFGVDPAEKLFHCFGCGRRAATSFTFVQETEGVDFNGALELLADRYGVQLEVARRTRAAAERRRAARAPARAARAHGRVLRPLPVGLAGGGAARASTCAGAASRRRSLREFRVGYAPSAWDTVLLASRRAGFSRPRALRRRASRSARSGEGRTYDRFRRRIMFPLCDARGRVLGFGARALGLDQKPEVPQHLRQRDLPQGPPPLRRRHRARAGGEGGDGPRGRGLHGRHRAAPGRAAPDGRAHGHRAHRRAGRRARAAGAERAARARRRQRRAGGDAACGAASPRGAG